MFFKSIADIVAANPELLKYDLGVISASTSSTVIATVVPDAGNGSSANCPVCLEAFTDGLIPYAFIPCGHVFCDICIRRLQVCAVCRVANVSSVRIFI